MSQMTRYCPGCGGDQLFEQPHAGQGACPDTPDGSCPEWACTMCGTALIGGFMPQMTIADSLPAQRDRAA
jgi:hypothetical protein